VRGNAPIKAWGSAAVPIALGREHFDNLPAAGTSAINSRLWASCKGQVSGWISSAKWAKTQASIASVLASRPVARAKSRTWRGLTTATGKPAAANSLAAAIS
jgi:hypothetical protein